MNTCGFRIAAAIALFSVLALSCSAQKNVWSAEGWIDQDTYRVRGYGEAAPGLTSPVQAKGRSQEKAVADAQRRLEERLKPPYDAGADDILPRRAADDVMAAVKAGKVIAVRYDAAYNCEIVYEVKEKGLWEKAVGRYPRH